MAIIAQALGGQRHLPPWRELTAKRSLVLAHILAEVHLLQRRCDAHLARTGRLALLRVHSAVDAAVILNVCDDNALSRQCVIMRDFC